MNVIHGYSQWTLPLVNFDERSSVSVNLKRAETSRNDVRLSCVRRHLVDDVAIRRLRCVLWCSLRPR